MQGDIHAPSVIITGYQQPAVLVNLVMRERFHSQPTLPVEPERGTVRSAFPRNESMRHFDLEIADEHKRRRFAVNINLGSDETPELGFHLRLVYFDHRTASFTEEFGLQAYCSTGRPLAP